MRSNRTTATKSRTPRSRWKPPEIEDVTEPFLGVRRRNTVPLAVAAPEVAAQWCYSKNCGWGPEDFSHASTVKAWWVCPDCQREYKAQVNNRTASQSGCSYCASKKVCEDNSFSALYPEVAKEWHPRLNGQIKASDFTYASGQMVWWRCGNCRHEWQAVIADRTKLESGCPACYEARMEYARQNPPPRKRGHVILNAEDKPVSRAWYEAARKTFVPLSESHPEVAKFWHPNANGEWKPCDFAHGSEAVATWKCPKGPDHEWTSPIYALTSNRKSGCPFCKNKRASVTNSLLALFPEIAKQWHPCLNGELTPDQVTAHSKKKVFWKCDAGVDHEWDAIVDQRTRGTGCPYCSRVRASKTNNLKALFPEVAAQLHPTKNKDLKAQDIAPYSSNLIWWKCSKGRDHEWQATPGNRTGNGSGCPYCTGKKASFTNSLASVYPKIAAEWQTVKNGALRPFDVTAKSAKLVWWGCRSGHIWQQTICKRTRYQSGCQKCKKAGINSLEPPRNQNNPFKKAEKIDFFDI